MKRCILLIVFFLAASVTTVVAQKLVYNEKAPQLQVSEFIVPGQMLNNKSLCIDFLVLDSQGVEEQLERLNDFAERYKGEISFIVVAKDDKEKVQNFFAGKNPAYMVAVDDEGETFEAYDVRYVPMTVLLDKKGIFVWQGRASQLTDDLLNRYR
ncbi:MAG TPA: TlpA family protein disulfide reductase [Candidatus Avirikenella pullistercoris]|nr:TlpA family protein disulfide reductase [Candidatus Avirikenella pullistercoris]